MMHPGFRRTVAIVVALVGLAAPSARAGDFDAATREAIKSVVSQQLEAFNRGDGSAAEAFAAPGIREKFPDPAKFLDMVKTNYAALLHPRSTQFVGLEDSPHGPLQKVTLIAADGTVWSAIYSFEKVDGEWRINGCGLAEDKSQQAI